LIDAENLRSAYLKLKFKIYHELEDGYDYLDVQISSDDINYDLR